MTSETRSSRRRWLKVAVALAACGALAIGVAACGGGSGSSAGSSASTGGGSGSGSMDGEGGEIVYFVISTQGEPYFLAQEAGIKEEAEKLDYKVKFITNEINPTQLQEQIQQTIAGGTKPKAFLLMNIDPKAGVNQARQLSQVAPVFQINQAVEPEAFEYIKTYTGPNDLQIGRTAGENLLKLRERLKSEGQKFRSPDGGLLVIGERPGAATTIGRFKGLSEANDAASQPLEILHNEPCCSEAEAVYEIASQLIPKYKSKLDFVYVQNNSAAAGAAKALKQNGLTPGKDVWMVTGNCGGSLAVMENEEVAATGEQLGYVEGVAAIQNIARYFATGEVKEGEATIKYSRQLPEPESTPPSQKNLLENPTMEGPESVNNIVYGKPATFSCPLE